MKHQLASVDDIRGHAEEIGWIFLLLEIATNAIMSMILVLFFATLFAGKDVNRVGELLRLKEDLILLSSSP